MLTPPPGYLPLLCFPVSLIPSLGNWKTGKQETGKRQNCLISLELWESLKGSLKVSFSCFPRKCGRVSRESLYVSFSHVTGMVGESQGDLSIYHCLISHELWESPQGIFQCLILSFPRKGGKVSRGTLNVSLSHFLGMVGLASGHLSTSHSLTSQERSRILKEISPYLIL